MNVFFDSNVLIYIHDQRFPYKRDTARRIYLRHLYQKSIVISTQVLQEFYTILTNKIKHVPPKQAEALTAHLAELHVVSIQPSHVLEAIRLHVRYKLSFWDSLILTAAKAAKASLVLSENLCHGQTYDGVRVENPFVTH
jgi:predicted nucleic acid-binding protein